MAKKKRINKWDVWRSLGLSPLPDRNKKIFAYDILERYMRGKINEEHFKAELLRNRELRRLSRTYLNQYIAMRNEYIGICNRFFKVMPEICWPHNIQTF